MLFIFLYLTFNVVYSPYMEIKQQYSVYYPLMAGFNIGYKNMKKIFPVKGFQRQKYEKEHPSLKTIFIFIVLEHKFTIAESSFKPGCRRGTGSLRFMNRCSLRL